MIPMVDLKRQYREIAGEIDAAMREVIEGTRFILGPNVAAFEQECAEYLGAPHAVACASGTDALMLALRAAGIGEGDEVITSPFTFIATAEAIRHVGANPVFVDIDPQSFNLDPDLIEATLTRHTRAVLPVHLFGQPADMEHIAGLCERYGLQLIEDCAQSFGASLPDGRMTGSVGDFGAFSFFPSKNLGGYGDGGLVTARSEEHAVKLRALRNHGSFKQYHHDMIGYNSRLDEMQAAILRVKLRRIDDYNKHRRRVANTYGSLLEGTGIVTPRETGHGRHVYHQYTILTHRRGRIQTALRNAEIASAIYYPVPLHRQKVFAEDWRDIPLPVAESVAQQCLSLPIFPELTDEEIERIAAVIRDAL
jgi:dTDP-4-amino-4,6-dideoxygalactose transaminase